MIITYHTDTLSNQKSFWMIPNSHPFKIETYLSEVNRETSLHSYVVKLTLGHQEDSLFSSDDFVDDLPVDMLLDVDKTNDFLLEFFNKVVECTAESLACAKKRNEAICDLSIVIDECKLAYPDIWPFDPEI